MLGLRCNMLERVVGLRSRVYEVTIWCAYVHIYMHEKENVCMCGCVKVCTHTCRCPANCGGCRKEGTLQ